MKPIRVSAFIDGFNLYHAIDELGRNHLKWLDLWKLCRRYAPPPDLEITEVLYFSAYATWRFESYRRHCTFVKALEVTGVTPVLGRFKKVTRTCGKCRQEYKSHEEKQTDVNIGLRMLLGAVKGSYDRAFLLSGDSDLAPAVKLVRHEAPQVRIIILTPPGRDPGMDLVRSAGGRNHCRQLTLLDLERSLLPAEVRSPEGKVITVRPPEYDPPAPRR